MDGCRFFFVCGLIGVGIGLEQQGDAPQTGQTDHGVDNARQQGGRTATDPSDQIKLEQANATPVERTDDGDEQS